MGIVPRNGKIEGIVSGAGMAEERCNEIIYRKEIYSTLPKCTSMSPYHENVILNSRGSIALSAYDSFHRSLSIAINVETENSLWIYCSLTFYETPLFHGPGYSIEV